MKVQIETERCQGHTVCNLRVPEVFQLATQDGHAFVADADVPPVLQDGVRQAAANCPERAIQIVEGKA